MKARLSEKFLSPKSCLCPQLVNDLDRNLTRITNMYEFFLFGNYLIGRWVKTDTGMALLRKRETFCSTLFKRTVSTSYVFRLESLAELLPEPDAKHGHDMKNLHVMSVIIQISQSGCKPIVKAPGLLDNITLLNMKSQFLFQYHLKLRRNCECPQWWKGYNIESGTKG